VSLRAARARRPGRPPDDPFQRIRRDRGAIAAAGFVLRLAEQDENGPAPLRLPRGEDDAADQQRFILVSSPSRSLGNFVVEKLVHREADHRVR